MRIKKQTKEFITSLVDSGFMCDYALEDKVILENIQKIIELTDEQAVEEQEETVDVIRVQFSKWLEEHNLAKKQAAKEKRLAKKNSK